MSRFLAGTPITLEVTFTIDGTLVDPTGTPRCKVEDEFGVTVKAEADATKLGGSTGKLQFALTATENADPKRLVVTWSDVVLSAAPVITQVTREEAVGDFLFTEAEARAFSSDADTGLANMTKYADSLIVEGRDRICDAFAEILNWSPGTRWEYRVLDGKGLDRLFLPNVHVTALKTVETRKAGAQTWTAFTAAELADTVLHEGGFIERETLGAFPTGLQNLRLTYEHGLRPPLELKRAAMELLHEQLVGSNIPSRAISQTDELGTFTLSTAGRRDDVWFGLPTVDRVLKDLRESFPVVMA